MTTRQALLLDGRRREHSRTLAVAHDALRDGLSSAGWAVDGLGAARRRRLVLHRLLRLLGQDAGRVRGSRSGPQRRRASHRERPGGPAHARHLRWLLSRDEEGLGPRHPRPVPFFRKVDGDTRHTMRYDSYPDLRAVGAMDSGRAVAEGEAETFRLLVARNALNLAPPTWAAGTLPAEASESEVRHKLPHPAPGTSERRRCTSLGYRGDRGAGKQRRADLRARRRWHRGRWAGRSAQRGAPDRQPEAGQQHFQLPRRTSARPARRARPGHGDRVAFEGPAIAARDRRAVRLRRCCRPRRTLVPPVRGQPARRRHAGP